MNQKQISFIMCVNDEQEFHEACYYIHRLHIPDGYHIDVIPVRNASSMTAGYNTAMNISAAKYKVYLHQDTFILDQNFIFNILKIFLSNDTIGMIGCIGRDHAPLNIHDIANWNTGAIYHNLNIPNKLDFVSACTSFAEVEVLDGLLLATQYDIPWRDDLFDGWDCYDMSQCFEMKRAGYKVVVPYQQKPWCYHDNIYSKFLRYYDYCNILSVEYQDIQAFNLYENTESEKMYYQLQESLRQKLYFLTNNNMKQELIQFFESSGYKGFLCLREFEVFAVIEQQEQAVNFNHFWQSHDSYDTLNHMLNHLKHMLRRLEYSATEKVDTVIQDIIENYSQQAIYIATNYYPSENSFVWELLKKRFNDPA